MKITYCKKCLIPDTKPYIRFNAEGVCDACEAHGKKNSALDGIDWGLRLKHFEELIEKVRQKRAPYFDVMVPVSGGKDSITQVHLLLKYGLRILAVNVDYGIKTCIGKKNLECIPEMGAHLVIFRPELSLHKRLIRIGLEDFGDPDLLSHTLLHGYPLHIALNFNIPMALLGENSAFEYGGSADIANDYRMSRAWFEKFAAVNGQDARFISRKYDIPFSLLNIYDYPDELDSSETEAVFSSHFFRWDSEEHLRIAKSYGFKALEHPGEGTYRNYVGIDEKINRIHQYLKVLKFGYGRATDHACEDIRNGRIDREEAKRLVRKHDLIPLSDYFIDDFVQFIGMQKKQFLEILENYRNKQIWATDSKGNWHIPGWLEEDGANR
jgi:N-acetyl sugar amidotransferase